MTSCTQGKNHETSVEKFMESVVDITTTLSDFYESYFILWFSFFYLMNNIYVAYNEGYVVLI